MMDELGEMASANASGDSACVAEQEMCIRDRTGALHPYQAQTVPNSTAFKVDAKYSWLM